MPQDILLTDLHQVLQAAMGWDNSHMFDFTAGQGRKAHRWFKIDPDWGSGAYDHEIKAATLADMLAILPTLGKHKGLLYAYDMGDNWEHELRPGNARAPAAGEAAIVLHDAFGACPPEDSGGAPGFSFMLECLADSTHEEHEGYMEWLGGPFEQIVDRALLIKRVAAAAKRLDKRYPV